MYPHAMTRPLPITSGAAIDLPDDADERLAWLRKILDAEDPLEDVDGNYEYLVFVDYDFPESLHDKLDWPPPARLCVQEHDVGPYTQLSVKGKSSVEKKSWSPIWVYTRWKAFTPSAWLSSATSLARACGRCIGPTASFV